MSALQSKKSVAGDQDAIAAWLAANAVRRGPDWGRLQTVYDALKERGISLVRLRPINPKSPKIYLVGGTRKMDEAALLQLAERVALGETL